MKIKFKFIHKIMTTTWKNIQLYIQIGLIVMFLNYVQTASIIDINQLCINDVNLRGVLPQCSFKVDLVLRQRCVEDVGMVMVLDDKTNEAIITCHSPDPLEVEIIPETGSFLSFGQDDRFTVMHGRATSTNGSSSNHLIQIPISIYQEPIVSFDVRKYVIRNAKSKVAKNITVPPFGVEIMVMKGGSSTIFSVGNRIPAAYSDITYIPCLYDYTNGIKVHHLSRYNEMEDTIKLDTSPSTYNPMHGFRFNLSTTQMLYSNYTFQCYGEGPSVNPFLPGPAVAQRGYGVEFHDGLVFKPMTSNIECYLPPCVIYCEHGTSIKLKILGSGDKSPIILPANLLFKTPENIERYGVHYTIGDKDTEVQCVSILPETVLHTWTTSYKDIFQPSTGQSLRLQIGPKMRIGINSSRNLQCISDNDLTEIQSLISLPCNNRAECNYYSSCIHSEDAVRQWQRGYTIDKQCSSPPTVGEPCKNSMRNCRQINLFTTSGRIFCVAGNNVKFESNYFEGLDGNLFLDHPNTKLTSSGVIKIENENEGDLYSGGSFWFTCESVYFCTEQGLQWKVKWKNGTITQPPILENIVMKERLSSTENPKRRSRILLQSTDIIGLICYAPLIYSNEWIEHELALNYIKKSVDPTITLPTIAKFDVGSAASLECTADGYPPPQVKWILEENSPKTNTSPFVESTEQSSTLIFPSFTEQNAGDYVCFTSNGIRNSTRKVTIAVKSNNITNGIIIGITLLLTLAFTVLILFMYRRWKNAQNALQRITDVELDEFLNGIQGNENQEDYRFVFSALAVPYDTNFELDANDLKIDKDVYLGSGQFGVVYKGTVGQEASSTLDTAVKTLKSTCNSEDIKSFLSEIKLMIYLGKHPNLVQIIGACTKNCRRGEIYLVLEFCDGGSLLNHLQQMSDSLSSNSVMSPNEDGELETESVIPMMPPTNYANHVNIATIGTTEMNQLVQWSYEISCGMEYMSKKGMIHGDIATRNILLQSHGGRVIAKISDFGLSRKLYEYAHYVKTKQEPLPWRWLAIETIRQLKFSIKSDVWAYGVTLWEIFSLGDVPFSGHSYDVEFLTMLENGYRNPKPRHGTDKLYDLMKKCWIYKADERPTFEEIEGFFEIEFQDGDFRIIPNYTNVP